MGPLELILIGLLLILVFGMGRMGLLKKAFLQAVASFHKSLGKGDSE